MNKYQGILQLQKDLKTAGKLMANGRLKLGVDLDEFCRENNYSISASGLLDDTFSLSETVNEIHKIASCEYFTDADKANALEAISNLLAG